MKTVFLAGPFRGDGSKEAKLQNVEIARQHARFLIDKEIPFYSPHLNLDQELINYPENREDFAISVNHSFLEKCDALAVLPGWEQSSGTKEEIQRSEKRRIPIFYLEQADSIQSIVDWLKTV